MSGGPPSPSKDVDIIEFFRSFLAQNVAVPVAAMNALVVAIKVVFRFSTM